MPRPIKKAVFPVAGLGTRFLPATKAVPKEMMPVVDMPIIQHVCDEAKEAGIEHFIFVTGRNKYVIEDHFDRQFELEQTLRNKGKTDVLERLKAKLPPPGHTSFTRQQEPLGLGHAVWCARHIVGHEPFALLLPDMLADASPGCLKQMMHSYEELGGNMVAVEEVPPEETQKYGIVEKGEQINDAFAIHDMVEKPEPGTAPSNLMIMGRYILQPEIFGLLESQCRGAGGEIQLTDAMIRLMDIQKFYGQVFKGRTYDCGSHIGFISANVALGLKRTDIAAELRQELEKILDS